MDKTLKAVSIVQRARSMGSQHRVSKYCRRGFFLQKGRGWAFGVEWGPGDKVEWDLARMRGLVPAQAQRFLDYMLGVLPGWEHLRDLLCVWGRG